jgi:hypothetical protein
MFENVAAQILDQLGPAIYTQVLEEFRTGEALKQEQVSAEVCSWAEVSPQRKHRGIDGMGHIDMDVPADIYFDWVTHEGTGFWKDKASKQWFLNKNPQFKVGYEARAAVAWTPTMDRSAGGLFLANARTSTHTMKTAA